MILQSGVDASNFDKVVELSLLELERMAENGVDDEELENAKTGLEKMYLSVKDSPNYLMDFYASQFMLGDADDLDAVIQKVRNVTKDDAERAAAGLTLDTVYTLS
jgi:predicted Zn-dependent peptidase